MVCLIKPQFEAGREKVGKKGVVRDLAVHEEVIAKVVDSAVEQRFFVRDLEYSPIKGRREILSTLCTSKRRTPADAMRVLTSVQLWRQRTASLIRSGIHETFFDYHKYLQR